MLWLLLLLNAAAVLSQTTTTTATLQDTNGVVWANANYTITVVSSIPPVTKPGNSSFQTSFTGAANSSGQMSVVLQSVANIYPANASWKFCITAPIVSVPTYCATVPIGDTGQANQDISAQIDAVLSPLTIASSPVAQAYADSEVRPVNNSGMYFNINTQLYRCYTTGLWQSCGTGAGGPPTGAAGGALAGTYPNPTLATSSLPLAGGTLTGPLNVGTTQFIDSSFYNYFANACAAAQVANATLLLTKTFTVPTGTYNCNIAVPVGVRSTSALLQAATNAAITFTGQYSGPFTPWIDIHTNSGASLVWDSASTLYPDYLGAKGDGSSDDTLYVQEFLTTLLNSGPNYGNPPGYGVPGESYLVTQPLNATCVDGYKRLSLWNLAITHKVTTGSPGAALDIGGCNYGVYYGLSVGAYGNNPANSPMVTSAILLSNGHWTSGYNAEAGGGSFFDHIWACGGYNSSTGTGAGTASFVDIGADLVTIQNSTLGCNGGGHGSGLVWGGGVGHSTAVTSAFYTFNPSPGALTAVYSYNNTIFGDYEPAIQFTGSAGYTVNGGYVTMIGTGLGGSELDINASGSQGNGLACQLLNTENQSSNGAVNVFNFDTGVVGGAFDCSGRFNTGASLIAVPNTYTVLNRVNIRNLAGGEGNLFALNPTGVQIYDSSFIAGYGTTSLGTVSGAYFGGVTLTARGIACSTMTANNGNPAGISGGGNHYYGVNGCSPFSDITVGAGGAFTVNGAGAVSAPSGSITALAAGTVTATGNITGQAGLNLPTLLTGQFQNYAPNSNLFAGGTGLTWSVQAGQSNFGSYAAGPTDPFGNVSTTFTCSTSCIINDTESGGTQIAATTTYEFCAEAQTTSGTQTLQLQLESVGYVNFTETPTISWQCQPITTVSASSVIIGIRNVGTMSMNIFGVAVFLPGESAGLFNTGATQQISQIYATLSAPLTAAQLTTPSGRTGRLQCTSGGAITVSNTNYLATSSVNFSTNTPGGTQTYAPNITASTPGTSFTATCAAGDTTLYNYTIWN